ncbi:hypothetical protein SELR_pSRC200790 (plasmid) [Selenomonas ruminantium subsp. lactilytica TAM6421]|uniref:DUF4145 domain-containing protein n=1 Tax=Selenomonas ruminantium subsp. lactilytica (strain NBRC 103574 / TAM6421) TaxID=927704 RepID=I0GV26_SELRL|nr:DUF4145 domain-containing protein [Selenomonas ruminantium]BAL84613.1 hypothetical protein SELR_pSRC200790 [Selenomonas ruminantium subsp. lactilytica TAM6421]
MSFINEVIEIGKILCGKDDSCLEFDYMLKHDLEEDKKRRESVPKEIQYLYRYNKKIAEILPKAYYNSSEERCLFLRQALEEFISSYELHSDKMNLSNKICYLQNKRIITDNIADKCHYIRKITNKGVHNSKVEISEINSCGKLLVDIILYKWPHSGEIIELDFDKVLKEIKEQKEMKSLN